MKTHIGNLLVEVQRGVILQQVNAQGVMGSGIAKSIREKWPAVWEAYTATVGLPYTQRDSGFPLLGTIIPVEVEPDLWVVNLVGQQFFGRDGRRYTSYDALDRALAATAEFLRGQDIRPADVHHPLLGCGRGGGVWSVVETLISYHLGPNTNLWKLAEDK